MNAVVVARVWMAAYAAAAVIAAVRAARRSESESESESERGARERVVLIRPLAGDESGLEARLEGTGGASLVVFAVGSRGDAAGAIARRVAGRLRARGVDASVTITDARGPNHKAGQLARAMALPRAKAREIAVVADADVELGERAVIDLVDALRDADAVWAPPVERGRPRTWGDRASRAVLDASFHSFPLLAGIDPGGLVGKLFAIRRPALHAIGGFEALTRTLGEDMELARRLRLGGRSIRVAPHLAIATAEGRTLREILDRYTRWLLVIRSQRAPLLLSYPLLLAVSPVLLVLLGVALGRSDEPLAIVAASGLVVRFGIACFARATAGLPFAPLSAAVESVAADVVLLIALARACTTRELTWRGRKLAIGAGGALRDASEQSLRELPEEVPPQAHDLHESIVNHGTVRVVAGGDGLSDARQLAFDRAALRGERDADVSLAVERRAERDPHLGSLGAAEDVTEPDRDDERLPRDTRDLRSARPEIERVERRALSALREDPDASPWPIEELGGATDGARSVRRLVHVDTERTDPPEERESSEVRSVHHRVPVALDEQLGDVESDERIPPRRVIGDEQQRSARDRAPGLVEPGDHDPAERPADARARVPREPGIEPAALRGLDHEASS